MFLLDTFPLKEVNSKESTNDVGTEVRQIAAKETVTNFNAVKGTRGPITTNKKALAKQKAVEFAVARTKLNNESALAKQIAVKEAAARTKLSNENASAKQIAAKEAADRMKLNNESASAKQIAAKETVAKLNAVKGTPGRITTNKKALAKQKAVKDAAARMKLNNESALAKQVDKKEASAVKTNVKGFYFYFKLSTFTLFINNIYI